MTNYFRCCYFYLWWAIIDIVKLKIDESEFVEKSFSKSSSYFLWWFFARPNGIKSRIGQLSTYSIYSNLYVAILFALMVKMIAFWQFSGALLYLHFYVFLFLVCFTYSSLAVAALHMKIICRLIWNSVQSMVQPVQYDTIWQYDTWYYDSKDQIRHIFKEIFSF